MPLIREIILITEDASDRPHLAPLGLIEEGENWIVAPFRPSRTLDNLKAHPRAIANLTDDACVFAGCLTGRRNHDLVPTRLGYPPRLAKALTHWELEVVEHFDDPIRPRFVCKIVAQKAHAPFPGHNRAFAAVVEAAVLTSRLDFLPREEIMTEFSRLRVIVAKTAGPREAEAFSWLETKVATHGAAPCR